MQIKSAIDFYSSLENFVKHFFNVLYVLRNERDNKAAISFQKTKVCYFSVSSPEEKYFKFLTNYAANFVVNQIERSRSVNNLKRISPHQFEINTPDFVVKFSLNVCACNFYTSMKLPYQHMRVQYGHYFPNFSYSADLFHMPLGEWNKSKIWGARKILAILCEINVR